MEISCSLHATWMTLRGTCRVQKDLISGPLCNATFGILRDACMNCALCFILSDLWEIRRCVFSASRSSNFPMQTSCKCLKPHISAHPNSFSAFSWNNGLSNASAVFWCKARFQKFLGMCEYTLCRDPEIWRHCIHKYRFKSKSFEIFLVSKCSSDVYFGTHQLLELFILTSEQPTSLCHGQGHYFEFGKDVWV